MIATVCATLAATTVLGGVEEGFTSLFNGKDLTGWKLMNPSGVGYLVQDGTIICPENGGGNLLTEKEFANFVLRFEFKLTAAGNNGIGIRAPLEGSPTSMGMEIQVLDSEHKVYRDLKRWQYHGSIYGIFPAMRGYQRPLGEWNEEEIIADGRNIKVTLNGHVILEEDLNTVKDPDVLHRLPGMLRNAGHLGFLGHNSHVEFRNIRIKELPNPQKDNIAPEGFTTLFNGKDLTGWKGLVQDPPARAKMSAEELQQKQVDADKRMNEHWTVKDGVIEFDGKGDSLCTIKDYADFELLVDWKIKDRGDSGIYLRGAPQVQIWDPVNFGLGSGGLYNNQKNPDKPLVKADNPIGEWNTFRIIITGEKVTVYLNNQLVVQNTTMENYWERDKPIYPFGQIELQNHGDQLWFKNIYIREIK